MLDMIGNVRIEEVYPRPNLNIWMAQQPFEKISVTIVSQRLTSIPEIPVIKVVTHWDAYSLLRTNSTASACNHERSADATWPIRSSVTFPRCELMASPCCSPAPLAARRLFL